MTLPKALRRRLGVERGGIVMAEASERGIALHPAVAFPIEIYSDARVREFDAAESALKAHLAKSGGRKAR